MNPRRLNRTHRRESSRRRNSQDFLLAPETLSTSLPSEIRYGQLRPQRTFIVPEAGCQANSTVKEPEIEQQQTDADYPPCYRNPKPTVNHKVVVAGKNLRRWASMAGKRRVRACRTLRPSVAEKRRPAVMAAGKDPDLFVLNMAGRSRLFPLCSRPLSARWMHLDQRPLSSRFNGSGLPAPEKGSRWMSRIRRITRSACARSCSTHQARSSNAAESNSKLLDNRL